MASSGVEVDSVPPDQRRRISPKGPASSWRPSGAAAWAAGAATAGIGLAAASGSIVGGSGTTASTGDVIPRAIIGAVLGPVLVGIVVGIVVGIAAGLAGLATGPAGFRARRLIAGSQSASHIAASIAVIACLGALIGIGSTPDAPGTSRNEFSEATGDGAFRTTDVAFRTADGAVAEGVASPIDIDGDGRADLVDGRPVVGFDTDGDGAEDGRLRPCSIDLRETVQPDQIAVNTNCSSTIDRLLPYDSTTVLSTTTIEPQLPSSRRDRVEAGFSDLQGTLVLLGGLLLVLAAMRFLGRQYDLVPIYDDPLLFEARAFEEVDDTDVPADSVVAALKRSLDSLLDSTDPRDAILAAYATLLEELTNVGLGKYPWEGPDEHCRRCLAETRMPAGPIDALVALFSQARFGNRPMTAAERRQAQAALADSIAVLTAISSTRSDARSDARSAATSGAMSDTGAGQS